VLQNAEMQQLSLVGPPASPQPARGRSRLYERIFPVLNLELGNTDVPPEVIHWCASAVVDALIAPAQRLRSRDLLLRMCDNKPVCWICGFLIDLAAPHNSDGCFSIDHVVPRSAGGGGLGLRNLKPAHRICNIVRSAPRGKPKRQARLEAFITSLRAEAAARSVKPG